MDKREVYREKNFVVFAAKFCPKILCSFSQKGYITVTDSCDIYAEKA